MHALASVILNILTPFSHFSHLSQIQRSLVHKTMISSKLVVWFALHLFATSFNNKSQWSPIDSVALTNTHIQPSQPMFSIENCTDSHFQHDRVAHVIYNSLIVIHFLRYLPINGCETSDCDQDNYSFANMVYDKLQKKKNSENICFLPYRYSHRNRLV